MSKQCFFRIILGAILFAALLPVSAQCEPASELIKGPIVITSSTLSADSGANKAVFEGSVVAKTDEMTLYSDRMTVFYSEEGDIEKIDARGNIKLLKGQRVLTSKRALYLAQEGKITFTGEPMAVEGNNIITGSEIVYLIDEDRSLVRNSKVYIQQDKGH
jgi:lipopolysaccharide export system protein LptA